MSLEKTHEHSGLPDHQGVVESRKMYQFGADFSNQSGNNQRTHPTQVVNGTLVEVKGDGGIIEVKY